MNKPSTRMPPLSANRLYCGTAFPRAIRAASAVDGPAACLYVTARALLPLCNQPAFEWLLGSLRKAAYWFAW